MSTDVDNAPPAAAPDPDDDGPYPGRSADGAVDAGADWVRAEMQRRMIENRSVRGRHARAADTGRAPTPARGLPRVEPRPGALPRQPPAAPVSPADLPENYVPRHSVQTPGPAAEPAPPITGPIPVVRPPADLPVRRRPPRPAPDAAGPRSVPPAPRPGRPGPVAPRPAAAGPETSSGPVGGPSLPPQGLPVRRRRGSGPGTPLQADVTTAPETWSRPIPVVPAEPARPPGCAAGEGPADVPWGSPGAPAGPVPPPAAGPAPSDAPPSDTPVPDVGEPAPAATPAPPTPARPTPAPPTPARPTPARRTPRCRGRRRRSRSG